MEHRRNSQIKMLLSLVFLVLLCYSSFIESSTSHHFGVRIKGGHAINITRSPYVLTIEIRRFRRYHFICGATAIHQTWAVTAATCGITARRNMDYGVRLRSGFSRRITGAVIYNKTMVAETIHHIEKVILHPEYNLMSYDYDVSIIKITAPFHFSDMVQKILMATEPPFHGTLAVVSGWGWKSALELNATRYLQQATVKIVSYRECKKRIPDLSPRMICAEDCAGNMDISCPIDDGGPLVLDYRLVGITTMYWLLDRSNCHGVFIDVSQIRDWVITAIAEESI